jgi:aminopeptidase
MNFLNRCKKGEAIYMINQAYHKLAKLAVEYSIEAKKGQKVVVVGPSFAVELYQALNIELMKKGTFPVFLTTIEGIREIFFKHASEEQLLYVDDIEKALYLNFDCIIQIDGDYNTRRFSNVDPEKLAKFGGAPERKRLREQFEKKCSSGEIKWVVIPFPCQSLAQEANMDLFTYTDFVAKSVFLDKEDPVAEWRSLQQEQETIVDYLNNIENLHVLGEDTDLILSVKGRKWINSSGQENLPDGEIYTGPVENSVNGKIRFTFPGIYSGQEIEDVYLEFKDGEVIKATAKKGQELLEEILKIENAKTIGEFAIGTNYGIRRFTKNMLFDEKIGGTLHCALGLGFEITGSKNKSAIHWDLLKDMKVPDSKVLADNEVIYEEGKWKIKN